MSPTLTAGTRLKTKSSGLSDFFGGNGLHSNPARHSPKQAPVAPSSPELAQRVESSSSSVKSKKSHIPFWGRRKGGNIQSLSPSKHKLTNNVPPSPPPPLPRPSGSSGTYSKNESSPPSSEAPSQPSLPSQLPPLNVSPPTLSSKFAAHFGPSKPPAKSRDIYASNHAPSSPPQSPIAPSSALPDTTLQPPETSSTSRPSVESHRSSTSTTRPTITVSISPPEEFYQDEDYNDTDLFTLPRSAPTPPGSLTPASIETKFTGTPGSTFDNYTGYFDIPSLDVASPSPPSSPRMQFPNPPTAVFGQYRIVRSPSRIKEKDATMMSRPGIPIELGANVARKLTTKRSTRKHSISVVKALEDALGTPVATDLEDPGDDSDTNTIPTTDTGKDSVSLGDVTLMIPRRRSSRNISTVLQQQQHQSKSDPPSTPPSPNKVPSVKSTSSSLRSSVSSSQQAGPPPTTPLPSPPVPLKDSPSTLSSLPTIPSMNSLPSRRSSALIMNRSLVSARPRAQTISAVPPPNANLRAIPNSASSRSLNLSNHNSPRQLRVRPEEKIINDDDKANKENKRRPTYEELESLLEESQNQYNTLTAYLKTVSEKLERENVAAKEEAEMWKKEADSWRREAKARTSELKKRDVEIDGLKWLILHPMPNAEDRNTEDYEDDDASTEAGSLATFGEQSEERASIISIDPPVRLEALRKRSMTLHDFRPRPQKFRRLKSSSSLRGSGSIGSITTGLGLGFQIPDVPYTKYTLGSSASMTTTTSAISSASSLAVPSLSATSTASSGLSAIPESPLPPVPIVADAEKRKTKEERRSSRTSGSSIVSLASMAASAAYTNNLKSARGKSIEQVLDNAPPNMDEVRERLRPFGGNT